MNIQSLCMQMPNSVILIAFVFYTIFEYFMGNTKYGSALGLFVEHPLANVITWIKSKL